jgi:curved DNA-binding protein CbpA
VTPDNNSSLFSRLNEAFVILSDGKARDAYDSLFKTNRKINLSTL